MSTVQPEGARSPDGDSEAYEVVFAAADGVGEDVVRMTRTSAAGPGGHPVYEDATGIVRAEISSGGEVRVLATGGGQEPARVLRARAVT
ncbi:MULTISPECIES: DUF6296 family protein [Streptomyces]|uniref:Uncharacterized protein n=1 Tax=Streptomyces virginiae TaxID=1961 RepID=A0ABQ3NRR0_STRVG|nr:MULTISPECIES: DUF6296 family protein [Streptomyces]KOU85180.1 hypothetical protein ADK94_16605 [Streptomyces sp. XY593]KOU95223.1 hypothetical protein ADK92_21450 [Streptomyces sp. XY533]KOV17543.1 hypothetical protein ADK91_02315 [Streptomyces sp. XY511]KOV37012.1 hypothetical protein ADK98_37835 [Streptomyces sp. H036]MBP2348234.1 hypothetical protein [Streptomyces virginiae]